MPNKILLARIISRAKYLILAGCMAAGLGLAAAGDSQAPADLPGEKVSTPAGIQFRCAPESLARIQADMGNYLNELGIEPRLYVVSRSPERLRYTLSGPAQETSTLDFSQRQEMAISDNAGVIPDGEGGLRQVASVSSKEIVLALMQHGRLTEFSGRACQVEALRDHVGIRQNIVVWAEILEWGWPDGGPARWNLKYWDEGFLKSASSLRQAFNDTFFNQDQYDIGCYTAAKLVVIQGILDYYYRIKQDPINARLVEARLLEDGDPLEDVEPARMWSFEPDFNPETLHRPGKILRIDYGIAPKNFVPGDWVYFLNTDPETYSKTGYEGSNPIYLGRNRFVDYYNDNDHFYTFEAKLDEVYQWRHKVFSRSRDKDRIVPLSAEDYERLSLPPRQGGLLKNLRTTPYYFGFEDLPPIKP